MGTREKILVFGMLLALAYGAYSLLSTGDKQENTLGDQDRQALMDQLKAVTDVVDQGRLSKQQHYVMEEALRPWEGNPFYRRPDRIAEAEQDQNKEAVPGPLPAFVYQGFVGTDGLQLALINGRAYAQGELLEEKGFVLVQIKDASVILAYRQPSGNETWRKEFFIEDVYQ